MEALIFYFLSALVLAGGIGVVASRNPVASALSLVLALLALACVYLTLGAEFLAAIQVLVYAGAIMVLFLFVILLVTQEGLTRRPAFSAVRLAVPVAVVAAAAAFAFVLAGTKTPEGELSAAGGGLDAALALFQKYVFPFEAASVILLAALIGAVVLAKRKGVK